MLHGLDQLLTTKISICFRLIPVPIHQWADFDLQHIFSMPTDLYAICKKAHQCLNTRCPVKTIATFGLASLHAVMDSKSRSEPPG
jgi:hypothetical protein